MSCHVMSNKFCILWADLEKLDGGAKMFNIGNFNILIQFLGYAKSVHFFQQIL